ncbi:Proline dehydrogenase 1, mitochondrial [Triplophysa tibetana]|uniref:Proline dehydrogenase n=1 Tax=Triplophysa tibetana TaxID=1572043 RepID=A0A5A9P7R5_9TELE|nr:Proline dehydrogenase 1, mitochondrial [Triplophysa tibetana]
MSVSAVEMETSGKRLCVWVSDREMLKENKKQPYTAIKSGMFASDEESPGVDHREMGFISHRSFGDLREGVTSAPTYFYADEMKCDQHMETFLKCNKAAGGSSEDGFSAIKITALGRPQFLQGKDDAEVLEQELDLERLQACLASLGAEGNIQGWFSDGQLHLSGVFNVLDWNGLIDDRTKTSDLLVIPNLQTGRLEPLLSKFTAEEEGQMTGILHRMDVLAKHAVEHGVRLIEDAEQTFFQPATSWLFVELQRIFNRDKAVIFNTYQCYLKVRLSLTRTNAQEPDTCLDYGLEEIELNKKANVMVASHNLDTVKHTLKRMNEMGLAPADKMVYFGQLLGMCDQTAFPQAGFPVYKYVPYGPVYEVMPYLSRRAQENGGIMKGVQMERDLLWKELVCKLTSGEVFHTPAL